MSKFVIVGVGVCERMLLRIRIPLIPSPNQAYNAQMLCWPFLLIVRIRDRVKVIRFCFQMGLKYKIFFDLEVLHPKSLCSFFLNFENIYKEASGFIFCS